MIKLDSYTDEKVFENCKEYIKSNLKAGDYFTSRNLQLLYMIGYCKAMRIMTMLEKEGVIKNNQKGLGVATVL